MRVLITGANGMIGQALERSLTAEGHHVNCLVRRPRLQRVAPPLQSQDYAWDPDKGIIDPDALKGLDGVIHLAGANIAQGRWTCRRKQQLRASRVEATTLLIKALRKASPRPDFFLTASAIGIYGDQSDREIVETHPAGDDFLGCLGQDWEKASAVMEHDGVRVVALRLGMVLSSHGGALKTMLPAFRWGIGAILGSGSQYVSWVSLEDVVGCVHFLLEQPQLSGPINVTAPDPVTFKTFAQTLGRVLHRPVWLRIPSIGVRFLFGEMGQAVLLSSCRVLPQRLMDHGFDFRHDSLPAALNACVKERKRRPGKPGRLD